MKRIQLPKETLYYDVTGTEANIDIEIWIKFINHYKESELDFLDECKKKSIDDMSAEELNRYTRLSKQNKIAMLFNKYKERKCTKEEHDAVRKNIEKHHLETFVASRMTKEEKDSASKFIDNLSKEELEKYIDANKDNYESLSVYDAYVLFIAREKLHDINAREHAKETMRRDAYNAQHLVKSLMRDFGPHFH